MEATQWSYERSGTVAYTVRWIATVDPAARLDEWRVRLGNMDAFQTYAEATYVKYHVVSEKFAVAAKTPRDWLERRTFIDKHAASPECFALLEMRLGDRGALAGAMLLRSTWSRDLCSDFLFRSVDLKRDAAVVLLDAALRIGTLDDANAFYVETAGHSLRFWEAFLANGRNFIKYDSVRLALEETTQVLSYFGLKHVSIAPI